MTFSSATHFACRNRPTLGARLAQSYGIWRQRQALKRLDSAALRDIGVSQTEADTEVRRPFWDAPETWYR